MQKQKLLQEDREHCLSLCRLADTNQKVLNELWQEANITAPAGKDFYYRRLMLFTYFAKANEISKKDVLLYAQQNDKDIPAKYIGPIIQDAWKTYS